MENTFELYAREQEHLEKEKKEHPELFVQADRSDSLESLVRIGVDLPLGKLPRGYIKFTPTDFIVEEIDSENAIRNVDFHPPSFEGLDSTSPTMYADLVKVGISTVDATKNLASALGVEEKNIGSAGIKDAYALTSQKISIRGVKLDALQNLEVPSLFLKNISSGKGAIQTGNLWGNRFTIFVRTEHDIAREDLSSALEQAQKNGVWNFFWFQRFGNRLLSHWWGLLLFQGNYRDTIQSYLCDPGPRELPYFYQLRTKAKELLGNWHALKGLFSAVPYSFRYEISLIEYLEKNQGDYVGALSSMPEQVKLWMYAYSSFLFNRTLSSYASHNSAPPETLPLVLSMDASDRALYKDFLDVDEVPNQFEKNLRAFPFVRLMHRMVDTKFYPVIHGYKTIPEGVVLSFDLTKGSYATTFLSHFFALTEGMPIPSWVKRTEYDTKELLGTGSLKETKERLQKYIIERSEREDGE
ncbi:MAG: tRNA pseudouridine(13) synthase TruD [bacterium]|nr:tRNA pseudouridine(13) synthase TruD [bacterium]